MIDLRSDTVTQPDDAMRQAMAAAPVGDDVFGEDPTVQALEDRAAALLGKAAAVFMPSGTMANLTAFLSQTRPGESVLMSEGAHPYHYEGGNMAVVGGLLPRLVPDPLCKLTPDTIAAQIVQTDDPHFSNTTLVAIENTTNRGGGAYYTPAEVAAIGALCSARGLRLHCDGARLFNAAAAAGCVVAALTAPCDTVSFCLSKGLGCPVGSVLAGDRETMGRARRHRKMLGGGMRQVGVLAAAGLHALDHNVAGLAEDHRRARDFRTALEGDGLVFPLPSPTNIVYLEVPSAYALAGALAAAGVATLPVSPTRVRVVFHRDVDDAGLAAAIAAFRAAIAAQSSGG